MFQIVFNLVLLKLTEGAQFRSLLPAPDFKSSWFNITSQSPSKAKVLVNHGLNEVPILVDVQVKSLDNPNWNFTFPGVGGCPRDDDNKEAYGGITYIFNNQEIIISAPVFANSAKSGWSIYTANDTYYTGPNSQQAGTVHVRVRAWKASSLKPADFNVTDIYVVAGSTNVSEVYVEKNHGLQEYPGLVIVRTKLLDGNKVGYMSDAVGASLVAYPSGKTYKNRYIVYGFNNQTVRAWISSVSDGIIYEGNDGYLIDVTAKIGSMEIYAWRMSTMPPTLVKTNLLGPAVRHETFELTFAGAHQDIFVKAWAESLSGANAGYRFPGSGAMAFANKESDPVCTYGGLVYAYSIGRVRFWRPTKALNAGLICIASTFGQGTNQQLASDANIVVHIWTSRNLSDFTCDVHDACIHITR